jgi:hypothetical protein
MRDTRAVSSTSLHDDADVTTPDPGSDTPESEAVETRDDGAADRSPRGRRGEPDAVCAAAVDLARAHAEELADPGTVGEWLGVSAEGDRLVMHSFASRSRGYRGWRWAVSVARAPRSRTATVCEVVLLPGTDAVLPPPWVPWSERLVPGDIGAGDDLPYRADDPNLDPGYTTTDDEDADQVALWELGLGRKRVLSREGREAAAERWYRGGHGPTADVAVHAPASCSTCGYLVHVSGALRQLFGVCANEWSPSDGRVVSLDHGCGAHSETDAAQPGAEPLPEPILDETGIEPVVLPSRDVTPAEPIAEPAEPIADVAASVPADDDPITEEPELDPEAPAHDERDPETPAHEEIDPEAPAHEEVPGYELAAYEPPPPPAVP